MGVILAIMIAITADVITYYICKWLDSDQKQ